MAEEYCSSFFEAMSPANLQWNLRHYLPTPPIVVKTSGVNVPCSTSSMLVLLLVLMYLIDLLGFHVPVPVSTRVTNPHVKVPHVGTPRTHEHECLTSYQILFWIHYSAVHLKYLGGSISTSLHTELKSSASRSLRSLCRWVINLPCLRIIAWSTVKVPPHTQVEGRSSIGQSSLSLIASRNSLSFRVNPSSCCNFSGDRKNRDFEIRLSLD